MTAINNYLTTITPVDALQHACTYLSPIDVLRFSRVSTYARVTLELERKTIEKPHLVFQRYLVAAGCPVQGVDQIPGQPVLIEALPNNPGASFAFSVDEAGRLSFRPSEQLKPEEKEDYRQALLSGQHHTQIESTIEELVGYQYFVLQRLATQSWNQARPLQELRNRIRMVEIVRQELSHLLRVFHLCRQFEGLKLPSEKRILVPNSERMYADLLNFNFTLARTEIVIGTETVPVTVKAKLDFPNAQVRFTIQRDGDIHRLGSLLVEKVWKENTNNPYCVREHNDERRNLTGPWLRCYLVNDSFGRNEATGDYPILRLFTQIAVELLGREDVERITIDSVNDQVVVFTMGGLLNPYVEEIKRVTRLTRTAQGQLFIFNPSPRRLLVYLTKKALMSKDPAQAACVDFELNAPPIPWRQYIAERPLLKGSGPVLPHFFKVKRPDLPDLPEQGASS